MHNLLKSAAICAYPAQIGMTSSGNVGADGFLELYHGRMCTGAAEGSLFIIGSSALEFWRRFPKAERLMARARRGAGLASAMTAAPVLPPNRALFREEGAGIIEALSVPVHVLVGDPAVRRGSKEFVSHLQRGPLPSGSFVRVGARVFVATPEMCFAQLANQLTHAQLVILGCELCGTYLQDSRAGAARRLGSDGRTLASLFPVRRPMQGDADAGVQGELAEKRDRPLTSTRSIGAFLGQNPGLAGRRAASLALKRVVDCSASSMESLLLALLCLPCRYGGMGFPLPSLNHRIDLDARARALSGHGYHLVDLFWEKEGIGAEYDGRLAHTRELSFDEDRLRENALKAMGVEQVNFTAEHIRNDGLLLAQASYLAEKLHVRARAHDYDWNAAHMGLRGEVLERGSGSAKPRWPGERPGLPSLLDALGAGAFRR